MVKVDQILPTLAFGDAIGNEALHMQRMVQSWGYESRIYTVNSDPRLTGNVRPYADYKRESSAEDILIFHYAIGSEVTEYVRHLPNRVLLIYHNITPHEYFKGISDEAAALTKQGRDELPLLRKRVTLAVGDSEYNQQELVRLGFSNTGVLPLILDFSRYQTEPNPEVLENYRDEAVNLVFVGRFAPNKRLDQLMRLFAHYKRRVQPHARLFLVGSYVDFERFYAYLVWLARILAVDDIHFVARPDGRSVATPDLVAYYKLGDIYVSMSEHEGFCVPLVESMIFGLPIVVYNSTAVPSTLGDAGILFNSKNYEELSETIDLLQTDLTLRRRIVDRQRQRLPAFDTLRLESIFRACVEHVVSSEPPHTYW
jgi:glycosyltransferase involved in cell wall biosynthesis